MQTPAPVDYAKATSVADALAHARSQHGEEARVVAGGHSLLPMMKLRLAQPRARSSTSTTSPSSWASAIEGDEIVVGAMTRHRDLLDSAILAEHYPIFREAEKVIADPIVRNRGTIGGSLCQADPAADLSAVGSALKGTAVDRRRPAGARTVPLREFHEGPYETVVGAGEMLTELRYPIRPGAGVGVREGRAPRGRLGRRARPASTSSSSGGVVTDCGIGLARRRRRPLLLARGRGRAASARRPTEENLAAAAAIAAEPASPNADQRGPADYKRHLAARAHPARAAPRRPSQPGSLTMQVTITVNGVEHAARRRAAHAARPLHPRRRCRLTRHPLGLRHLQLRRLHRAGSTASR